MEQKKPSVLLSLLAIVLCAGSAHGMRLLHDVDTVYGRDFAFGSLATAATETAAQDTLLDDYEDEISRVEFEPERGTPSYAATVAPADAPAPGPGPATAGSDDAATSTARPGTGSMKWWLPPSTMPSFPLFPNPGGMPGMPLPAMPVPMPMPGGGIPGMPAMPAMPMPGAIPAGGGLPGMPMPGGMPAPFNFKPTGWGAGAGGGAGTASSPPAQAQPSPPATSTSTSTSTSEKDNDNPSPTESIIN